MQEVHVRAMRVQRGQIRRHWERLLRTERTLTPLASPDTLAYLIDPAIEEVFGLLDALDGAGSGAASRCACGRNPYVAFYVAGRQAMREALVLAQAAAPRMDPADRDGGLADLDRAIDSLSARDIDPFCAVCQYRADPLQKDRTARFDQ